MGPKISKAQTDVWEWKEKAYEAVKGLPIMEQLKAINEQTSSIISKIKFKKDMQTSIQQMGSGEVMTHEDLKKDTENL